MNLSRKTNKRRTLSRRLKYKKQRSRRSRRSPSRSRRSPSRSRRTRRQNKMRGGSNGIGQILTNSGRFTKNSFFNLYNKFKGDNLKYSANPTIGQFQ